jgi:hypothetical protein
VALRRILEVITAYKSLSLDRDTPPRVRDLIQKVENKRFSDVHTMLRLPITQMNLDLSAGCNFAIAQVLLAVIGGISATLYEPNWRDNARFKGVLNDYYPWNQEPAGVDPEKTASAIYEVFRNPLTHDLGLDIPNKRKGDKLLLKRLKLTGGQGLSESFIETQLEGFDRRTGMSATLTVTRGTQTLLVEALYWGVRRMIENISADKTRMETAEKFLSSR